jgi:hypothetical protein
VNKTFQARGLVTLAAGINSSATSVTLGSDTELTITPSDPPLNGTIWCESDYPAGPHDDPAAEEVLITEMEGSSITAMTRGQEGTAAAAHNTSGKAYKLLYGYPAKSDFELLRTYLPLLAALVAGTGSFRLHPTTFAAQVKIGSNWHDLAGANQDGYFMPALNQTADND